MGIYPVGLYEQQAIDIQRMYEDQLRQRQYQQMAGLQNMYPPSQQMQRVKQPQVSITFKEPKTFREELQKETDSWLED